MHSNYRDILQLAKGVPLWHDQNGTPRYLPFEPSLCPDIYSHTVVLAEIACQDCGRKFAVEMHAGTWDWRGGAMPSKWHYGDPPVHGCVGDTENCEDLAILEAWHREGIGDWRRHPEFEGLIDAS
jgi:hypothetical protein